MDPAQLAITAVTIQHFKSIQTAVSIEIRRTQGRLIALVGVNGAGKTVCLEAVAFACGAPPGHIRVTHLSDLVNGSQMPTVTVLWKSCSGKELKVKTTLNKDRERVFRMNGKIATKGLVVRTLLKERLYGDFTFIRQTQVGKIVQSGGSSKALASIISEVSGGACQKEAAAQAASSLTIFQTQLAHVRHSIAVLQSCINSDNKASAAQDAYRAAVHVCNAHAQELAEAAKPYQKLLEDRIQILEADIAFQERFIADFGQQERGSASSAEAASLRDAQHELETSLQQLEQAQAAALMAAEEALQAQGVRQDLLAAQSACSTHAQHLKTTRAALDAQEVILKGVKGALGTGEKFAALQQFRRDLGTAEDEANQLRTALQGSTSAIADEIAVQTSLKKRLEQHVQTAEHRDCIQDARKAKHEADKAVALLRKELAAAECHADNATQKLLQRCPQFQIAATAPFLTSFTFKSSCIDVVERCQLALSLLMQPVQEVLLVPRMTDVSRVLKANRGSQSLRVWPLDSITFTDRSSYLGRICKEWQAGLLVNPIDLCDFESAIAPAMQRVFGTVLIAANDHVASEVLARHGVTCITHAGTRHSKGSLEGGWRAPGSTASICSHKIALHKAHVCVAEVSDRLQKCSVNQGVALERLRVCEEIERVQMDLLKQVKASEASEKQLCQQLNHFKESLMFAENKIQDLEELIAGTTCHSDESSGSLAAHHSKTNLDTAQLKQAAAVAEQRVEKLRNEVTEAEHNARVLIEAQNELEQRLEGLDIDVLEYAKDDAERRLEECQDAVNDCRMCVTMAEEACARTAAEQKMRNDRAQNVSSNLQEAKSIMATLTEALGKAWKEQKSTQKSYDLAKSHMSEHGQTFAQADNSATNTGAADDNNPSGDADRRSPDSILSQLRDAEFSHSKAMETFLKSQKHLKACIKNQEDANSAMGTGKGTTCASECHAANTRKEVLKRSQDHMKMLEEASKVLRNDVEISAAYSMTLGRAVFERTALNFKSSMESAIPQLSFDVRMCGDTLEDGVEIIFRESQCKDTPGDANTGKSGTDGNNESSQNPAHGRDASNGDHATTSTKNPKSAGTDWSSNLAELSEGQRSICALVFVMAAASAGVKPAVLLVDEVDAALDGVNQSRAGELLAQAASALHCQVWAISHSDAFHACCDTYLRVSKEAKEGTRVEVLDAASWQGSSGAHKQAKGSRTASQVDEKGLRTVRPVCSAPDGKRKRGNAVKKRKLPLY